MQVVYVAHKTILSVSWHYIFLMSNMDSTSELLYLSKYVPR